MLYGKSWYGAGVKPTCAKNEYSCRDYRIRCVLDSRVQIRMTYTGKSVGECMYRGYLNYVIFCKFETVLQDATLLLRKSRSVLQSDEVAVLGAYKDS